MDYGGWMMGDGASAGAAVTVAEARSVVQDFSPSMRVCNSMHHPCLETGFGSQRRGRDVVGWLAGRLGGWVVPASLDQFLFLDQPGSLGPSNNNTELLDREKQDSLPFATSAVNRSQGIDLPCQAV